MFAERRLEAESHNRQNDERGHRQQLKRKKQKYADTAEQRVEGVETRARDSSAECKCLACMCTLCTPANLKQKSMMQQGITISTLCDLLCTAQIDAFWYVISCLHRLKQHRSLGHRPLFAADETVTYGT